MALATGEMKAIRMDTGAIERRGTSPASDAAERFYSERIPEEEKKVHRGEFVAIDASAGRFAFGRTSPEALRTLGTTPGGPLPYLRPVGFTFRLRFGPRS